LCDENPPAIPATIMKKTTIAILLSLVSSATVLGADPTKSEESQTIDAVAALKLLQEGNARFIVNKPRHPHESSVWRQSLEQGQEPFAVVLGCSDSRVPPDLVFDQGFGDLFTVRVAGNVVDTDVIASIEYAIDHLDTSLIVVMGHTNCGAVTATLDHLTNAEGEPAEVVSLLYQIEPAVIGISDELPREKRVNLAVRRNVELAVRRLSRVPDLRRSVMAGKIKIAGAVYDMHTGKVEFLD
jgi:carbonic anhydrase